MALCLIGDKPLSEPMLPQSLLHSTTVWYRSISRDTCPSTMTSRSPRSSGKWHNVSFLSIKRMWRRRIYSIARGTERSTIKLLMNILGWKYSQMRSPPNLMTPTLRRLSSDIELTFQMMWYKKREREFLLSVIRDARLPQSFIHRDM